MVTTPAGDVLHAGERLERRFRDALERLEAGRVVERIWERDHTVWAREPEQIADRLGWLEAPNTTTARLPALAGLARQLRAEGMADVVLLGMGGSSLGAAVLAAAFEPAPGHPRLRVLDSTIPSWVRRAEGAVDPARTLFLAASKSGTTAEMTFLLDYFQGRLKRAPGVDDDRHLAAITDPHTPLASRATAEGFRHTFLNPPDIGGRFSVLSLFGMVPAALMGLPVEDLLARAAAMARACRAPAVENPGARVGALLAAAAEGGRWQVTLLASPRLERFGLWLEQLLAESTGKQGRGLLPVTGEPAAEAGSYGEQRLFVLLRLAGDGGGELEARRERLTRAGHPVLEITLAEVVDLGGELFRWQMATAVVAHLLRLHPFNQPDVEATKANTRRLLERGEGHHPPSAPADEELHRLRRELRRDPPSYVALMAYADAAPELEEAVGDLRRALLSRYRLTTTFGYAPRLLHSTGQLHKGGPPGGLFVQLVSAREERLEIPGRSFGFRELALAQAAGDREALHARGRRALPYPLGDDPAADLARLTEILADG